MNTVLEIASGESRCTIAPRLGGSLTGWRVAGQALLYCASDTDVALGDCLMLASFPLVPYSNRIGNARFEYAGASIALTANSPPEPHAIHGTGWKNAWTVSAQSADAVILDLNHRADARWPWPFSARQEIAVTPAGLSLNLTATNLADQAVPLGFGHHPYFDSAGARLQFVADSVWQNGPDMLPTTQVAARGLFNFANPTAVAERQIDHCFSDWDGRARINWKDRPLALEIASDLPAAVVYIPAGGDRFCFEPVPHCNDALNRHDAMPRFPVIEPGESFTARIVFAAIPARIG